MTGKIRTAWLLLATVVILWSTCLLRVPPLDFDEALYRRIAEEMLQSGNFLLPHWDGAPVFDKPPTYLWTITGTARLLDPSATTIPDWLTRLPSILFSVLTVALLMIAWRPILAIFLSNEQRQQLRKRSRWLLSSATPGLFFSAALLPTAGAGNVLLDPMLMFALTPVVLLLTLQCAALLQQNNVTKNIAWQNRLLSSMHDWRSWTVGAFLAIACMIKGLIGIVLPGFALAIIGVALAALLLGREENRAGKRFVRFLQLFLRTTIQLLAQFGFAFALGTLGAALFYILIYRNGGAEFVYEFFITHHFRRGSSAMEGHSGSPFYHLVVLLLGGLPLSSLVVSLGANRLRKSFHTKVANDPTSSTPNYAVLLFPLSWCASFLIFFGAMATKLPNYTWPVWPAFALIAALLAVDQAASNGSNSSATQPSSALVRTLVYAVASIPFLLAVFFALAPFAIVRAAPYVEPRARLVLETIGVLPAPFIVGSLLAAFAFSVMGAMLVRFVRNSSRLTNLSEFGSVLLASALLLAALGSGVVPTAVQTFVEPVQTLTRLANSPSLVDYQLTTLGLRSPTVSSLYKGKNPPRQFRSKRLDVLTEPETQLLLAPLWLFSDCKNNGFSLIQQEKWVGLFLRKNPSR